MRAREILALSGASGAQTLFPGDPSEVRKRFRKLVSIWHPDHCDAPEAAEVFRHLMDLRDLAAKGETRSAASGSDQILTGADGRKFRFRVASRHMGDIGETLVGRRTISHLVLQENADLAGCEREAVSGFDFADARMRQQMERYLPNLLQERDLEDGGTLFIYERPAGEVLLCDLINAFGPLPPVHAAWLCSGLLNIAAWLSWSGRVHGAISLDTVMVNPETHLVRLIGGWAFSALKATRPAALPNRTLDLFPSLAVKGRGVDEAVTLRLIRRTVLESMGDPAGTSLEALGVPTPVANFLRLPPQKTGIEDYQAWQKALKEGWGARKFVVYPHDYED